MHEVERSGFHIQRGTEHSDLKMGKSEFWQLSDVPKKHSENIPGHLEFIHFMVGPFLKHFFWGQNNPSGLQSKLQVFYEGRFNIHIVM